MIFLPVRHNGRLINNALTASKRRGMIGYLNRINESPRAIKISSNLCNKRKITPHSQKFKNKTISSVTINYLKTDNTTKASHLCLGNVMFRMTWQARIVDTCNLGPRDNIFS
jgi:hypothetical protein